MKTKASLRTQIRQSSINKKFDGFGEYRYFLTWEIKWFLPRKRIRDNAIRLLRRMA